MENLYFSFGIDGRLLINEWGKDAARVTGKAAVDVMGKKYYKVLPRILANDRDAALQVLRTGKTLTLKGHYFNSITGQIKADIRIDPVKGAQGKVKSVSVHVITYRQRFGEKTNNAQRLIDTGKTATAFVHSVRNPLNAIKGAVVYLRSRYSQESTLLEFTNIIEQEISTLDDFISRFLSASASEAELSETDINSMLKKIEILTSLQARARNVGSGYFYGDVPPVTANAFQLEQAVLNVINNALEALRPGEEFKVSTLCERCSENNYVVIEVSDTGPGMALPEADEISVPLNKRKGRGFGLLITREILKQNGGHMEITSRKDGGTTVRIYLPALTGEHDEHPPKWEGLDNRR